MFVFHFIIITIFRVDIFNYEGLSFSIYENCIQNCSGIQLGDPIILRVFEKVEPSSFLIFWLSLLQFAIKRANRNIFNVTFFMLSRETRGL